MKVESSHRLSVRVSLVAVVPGVFIKDVSLQMCGVVVSLNQNRRNKTPGKSSLN